MWPRLHAAHAWLGRFYIVTLIWCTGTSLIIHNTGLPPAVLISFVWVLGGVTLAWALICVHTAGMDRKAAAAAGERLEAEGLAAAAAPGGLPALLAAERARLAAGKTFAQRAFSLKAAHGALMFVAWFNVVGRIFATPGLGDFTCYTYRERRARSGVAAAAPRLAEPVAPPGDLFGAPPSDSVRA